MKYGATRWGKQLEFTISPRELQTAADFIDECLKKLLEKQRSEMPQDEFEKLTQGGTIPYTGAIGGGVTYSFHPTSLGASITVSCFGEEKDVTDYGSW